MTTKPAPRQGLLRRLRHNRAGNVIVLTGAAMVPMAALAGSAVDMSRIYLVRARLQQACDAGALAGRRFMNGATFDANAQAQANSYFNFNFPTGAYGVTSRTFAPSRTANGQVAGVANATVPMVVMNMFGMEPKTLSVECEAKFEVANTDVVFVLDTTGSMACDQADDTATCNTKFGNGQHPTVSINGRWQARQATNSRIKALRTAIRDFYETLDSAVSSDARLRFGFVPYSSSVNVGPEIMAIDPAFISDSATYQSRRRVEDGTFRTTGPSSSGWSRIGQPTYGAWTNQSASTRTETQCRALLPSPNPVRTSEGPERQQGSPDISYRDDTETTVTTYRRRSTETEHRATWTRTSGQNGRCVIATRLISFDEERTSTSTRTPNYVWRYEPIVYDTSRFKRGDAVTANVGSVREVNGEADRTVRDGTAVTAAWSGCIQERDTVANAEVDVGDTGAFDLDIDLLPSDAATRWQPSWPEVVIHRDGAGSFSSYRNTIVNYSNRAPDISPTARNAFFSCPKAADGLREMTRGDVDSYVDAADFVPHGGTYHDIGLLWGARLISPTGIFRSHHATPPNGGGVQRHVIFMTDGDMSPNEHSYSSYGVEVMEGRIGSNDVNQLKARHNYRFESICRAIRNQNVTLWVVAYGQNLTPELTRCATPGLAFAATNAAQLQSQFRQIAAQIAELRLDR